MGPPVASVFQVIVTGAWAETGTTASPTASTATTASSLSFITVSPFVSG